MAKDLEERRLERQGIADLWRRLWKADVIVGLQDSHAKLVRIDAGILARMEERLAKPNAPFGPEDAVLFQCGERVNKMLAAVRGDMMQMGLHPSRPRATQPTRPNRPRGPIHDAELVPMPRPEAIGPSEVAP